MPTARPTTAGGAVPVPVSALPAWLRPAFPYRYFNLVQSDCFAAAYGSRAGLVVCAPTGSGKTGVLELALARQLADGGGPGGGGRAKAIYIAPTRALVQERIADWHARLSPLGIAIAELTGDVDGREGGGLAAALSSAQLVCATPEKLDAVTRGATVGRGGSLAQNGGQFVGDIGLVMLDEVHLLNEERGSVLEAVVSRIKMIGGMRELAELPVSRARFVAVSATLPNASDVGAWVGAPPAAVLTFGDDVRPVPLRTLVRGYPPANNDFLFERRLNSHLLGLVQAHAEARPTLVFCSSRKGAADAAAQLSVASGGSLVPSPDAGRALAAGASAVRCRALAQALLYGIGYHHAGLEPGDRAVVEGLFSERWLPVLCTTSTLAVGVNLPAFLVVVRGTRRYAPPGGWVECDRAAVLQMVGRAGRPQFDDKGMAVIMTQSQNVRRYASLTAGVETLESRLGTCVADALNAEIVLRTVPDAAAAAAWLKNTFLWIRAKRNPAHYGLPATAPEAVLERLALQTFVVGSVQALAAHGLATTDGDGFALAPTRAGRLAAAHYLRLPTMAALLAAPPRASTGDLLDLVCRAAELGEVTLRRGDKKVLNELNKAAAAAPAAARGGSHWVPAPGRPAKAKDRLETGQEKLFVLINACLSDVGTDRLDFSMRTQADQAVRVGRRVAACFAALAEGGAAFAAAANGRRLARSLAAGVWDGADGECRQLPGVGRALAGRLAAAGLGSLRALASADPRRVEAAAQRHFPFGDQLTQELAAALPPATTLVIRCRPAPGGGSGLDAVVTLTRGCGGDDSGGSGVAPTRHRRRNYARLMLGTLHDDALLYVDTIALETFSSPHEVRVRIRAGVHDVAAAGPHRVVAALLHDRWVGLDVVTWAELVLEPPAAGRVSVDAATSVGTYGDGPPRSADVVLPLPPPGAADVEFLDDDGRVAAGKTGRSPVKSGSPPTSKRRAVDAGGGVPRPPTMVTAPSPPPSAPLAAPAATPTLHPAAVASPVVAAVPPSVFDRFKYAGTPSPVAGGLGVGGGLAGASAGDPAAPTSAAPPLQGAVPPNKAEAIPSDSAALLEVGLVSQGAEEGGEGGAVQDNARPWGQDGFWDAFGFL